MSNDVFGSAAIAVASLLIGYLLSELQRFRTDYARRETIRKAIATELCALLLKLNKGVKNRYVLSWEDLPFVVASYEALRSEASAFLDPELLLQIDEIYTFLKHQNRLFEEIRYGNLFSLPERQAAHVMHLIEEVTHSLAECKSSIGGTSPTTGNQGPGQES